MTQQSKPTRHRPKPGPRKPGPRKPTPHSSHGAVRRRTGAPRPQPKPSQPRSAPRASQTRQRAERSQQRPAPRRRQASIPQRRSKATAIEADRPNIRWWLIALICLIAAIIFSLLEAPLFEARSVNLSGNARTSEGLVLDALAIPDDQALLLYDIDAAEEAIGALPWVREVSIARQWPSTLQVVIGERGVAASIGRPDGSEWLVVSEDGFVVERRATPPAGVPLIVATNPMVANARIGELVDDAAPALDVALNVPRQLDAWITTWTLDGDGALTAELVGSARATFGTFKDARTQFVSLASILDGGAELTCLDLIDLSVVDTPVLHRNTECIAQSAELS